MTQQGALGSIAPQAITTILAGSCRLPFLFASLGGTLMLGEVALRSLRGAWRGINAFAEGKEYAKYVQDNQTPPKKVADLTTWDKVKDTMRPFGDEQKWSNAELVKIGLIALAVGIVGGTLVAGLFGEAPAIYNHVLSYMGPVRLSNDLWVGFATAKDYFQI